MEDTNKDSSQTIEVKVNTAKTDNTKAINNTKAEQTKTASANNIDELIASIAQEPPHTNTGSSNSNSRRGLVVSALAVISILSVSLIAVINSGNSPDTAKVVKASSAKIAEVKATTEGFFPATVVIKKGSVVSWSGPADGGPIIVASNPYPNNNKLSSLKSNQLSTGASYRYKFNDTGTYTYHDDLNPTNNGTIIVQ